MIRKSNSSDEQTRWFDIWISDHDVSFRGWRKLCCDKKIRLNIWEGNKTVEHVY